MNAVGGNIFLKTMSLSGNSWKITSSDNTSDTETREFNVRLSLSREEWESLERYAENEDKSLPEYLDQYMHLGALKALREGFIYDAFMHKSDFQLAEEASCTSECPQYAAGTCPYDFLEKGDCPRIKEALEMTKSLND